VVVAETEIRRVAVVDDDPSQADVMGELIRDAGYEPIILGPRFERVEDLVGKVRESADAAICDHRLRPRGYARFDGAEAVASLVDMRIPSLLVTQYFDIDADVSIRLWRHRVPVLLSRDDADPDRIVQGFGDCVREIRGEHLLGRRPWRTLIQVDEVADESGERVVDAHIPSWNPHQAVRFPAALIPPPLQAHLAPGAFFFARVNIGAERAADLYFSDFESAPDPEPEDVLLG
jgi:CheY-like chemotaxis protein